MGAPQSERQKSRCTQLCSSSILLCPYHVWPRFPRGILVYPLSTVGKFLPSGIPFPWALLGSFCPLSRAFVEWAIARQRLFDKDYDKGDKGPNGQQALAKTLPSPGRLLIVLLVATTLHGGRNYIGVCFEDAW